MTRRQGAVHWRKDRISTHPEIQKAPLARALICGNDSGFFRLAPDPVPYETTATGQGVIMKKSAALLLALGVAGCQSTGVMPIGPDTYRIQTAAGGTLTGGSMVAQKAALDQANEYCAQRGKQFVAIGFYDNNPVGVVAPAGLFVNTSGGNYQVDFR